jgi:hypothetical protein
MTLEEVAYLCYSYILLLANVAQTSAGPAQVSVLY